MPRNCSVWCRGGHPNKKCIWLHAVSVGEVNLLAPLLRVIERERPDWECVISTTTKTGMALAKKKYAGRTVFYCPLDFTWAVNAAMRRIRPDVLVLAELELWPNLVWAARRHGARVAVINGRLSQRSFDGYRRIRPLVSRLLGSIDRIAVQDETYSRAVPRPGGQTGSSPSHGFHEVRRRPDRSRQPRHASPGRVGRTGRGRRGLSRRQHPGAGRVGGPAGVSAIEPRLAATASDHRSPAPGTVRLRRADAGRFRRGLAAPHACWKRAWTPAVQVPRPLHYLACCWSTWSASWGPGGERPTSPLSAAVSAIVAGRT